MRASPFDVTKPARQRRQTFWLGFLFTFFSLGLVFTSIALIYNFTYHNKVFYGLYLNNQPLAGQTKDELRDLVNDYYNQLDTLPIIVSYEDKTYNLRDYKINNKLITTRDLVHVDGGNFIKQALTFGRQHSLLHNLITQAQAGYTPHYLNYDIKINEALIQDILHDVYSNYAQTPANASLKIKGNQVDIGPAQSGFTFDFVPTTKTIKTNLLNLSQDTVYLTLIETKPDINVKNSTRAVSDAQNLLSNTPILLKTLNNEFELSAETLQTWFKLSYNNKLETVDLDFDNALVDAYLTKLSQEINVSPIEAEFEEANNKIVKFRRERQGERLAIEQNRDRLKQVLLTDKQTEIDLIVYIDKPKTTLADLTDYGLSDLLGIGSSNFAGSPANRRHNIAIGAAAVNGQLIAPGEEFSLITVLGDIDADHGYKPELVIKDNKTVPEFGGGLCQIGTTTFRGALAAGLLITERRNHSYRVSYYEPAGTDATIYDPKPDFRFKNDTANYIMILTRIEGDNIYFEYWGTDDGRIASQTDPEIYAITPPPPTKIIETLDLEPGVKKCTEHAHNGAKAKFTYSVLYPGEEEPTEVEFFSHYQPWQEVCLLGVEELSEDPDENNSDETSTETQEANNQQETPPAPDLSTVAE